MKDYDKTDWITSAKTLSEALPYLKRYDSATKVIKLGGAAMSNIENLSSFARDIVLMKQCKVNPIIIHGGGPMINNALNKWGIDFNFVDGKRVTDKKAVKIVEMVLSGDLNNNIVSSINNQGGKGVGISGKDASLVICEKDNPELGYVGKPILINTKLITTLVENDFIPVISPIGTNEEGETFNINADTAAGAIAKKLKARRLIIMSDIEGVLDNDNKLISEINTDKVNELIKNETIFGGMIPKIKNCLEVANNGVKGVVIIDG